MASYDRLDGRDLRDGAVPHDGEPVPRRAAPFDVETLTLEIDSRIAHVHRHYGVTDRFDISAAVPLVALSMDGTRVNTYRGTGGRCRPWPMPPRAGLGDIAVRGKYGLLTAAATGLARGRRGCDCPPAAKRICSGPARRRSARS